jgi:hypothetical protein
VSLIAEALGLCCKILGLISGNAALMDVDGQSLLEGNTTRSDPITH